MKPYPEFEGYLVTEDGRVFTTKLGGEVELKQKTTPDGYLSVSVKDRGKQKQRLVHRMVMWTYVGPSRLQVNHKDFDKMNNNLSNLEYCTPQENSAHAREGGRYATGNSHKRSKLPEHKVAGLMTLKGKVRQKVAAQLYGVSQSLVSLLWREEARAGQVNYKVNRGRKRKYE